MANGYEYQFIRFFFPYVIALLNTKKIINKSALLGRIRNTGYNTKSHYVYI